MNEMAVRQEKVTLAVAIGEELLKNGGEVYRVNDTIEHILKYYGFQSFNVFVVSNGIFITVDEHGENPISLVRNVPNWSVNLGKVAELNRLSREICEGKQTFVEAEKQLNDIRNMKPRPLWMQMLATAIGSSAFCYTFGGKLLDMSIAFVAGLLLKWFLDKTAKKQSSKFIKHIIGSVIVTVMAVISYKLIEGIQVDKVIIGSIMLLVPGVALTTSIRDFFAGDYLSGGIHLIDALLTAVCIAAGVGVAMEMFMLIGWV